VKTRKRTGTKTRSPQQERLRRLRENGYEARFKRALERTAQETKRLMGKGSS
jgi:hypothetical protein